MIQNTKFLLGLLGNIKLPRKILSNTKILFILEYIPALFLGRESLLPKSSIEIKNLKHDKTL